MAILLGLLAALSWGTGDFAGGMATRRAAETAVVLGTETIGLILLLVIAPLVSGSPTGADLVLGSAAGLVGVAGLAFLFPGVAPGRAGGGAPPRAGGAAPLPGGGGRGGGADPRGGGVIR